MYQITSPVRFQTITYTQSERFPRKRNGSLPISFAPSDSMMFAHRPEKLRRMFTGSTAMKISVPGGGFSTEARPAHGLEPASQRVLPHAVRELTTQYLAIRRLPDISRAAPQGRSTLSSSSSSTGRAYLVAGGRALGRKFG